VTADTRPLLVMPDVLPRSLHAYPSTLRTSTSVSENAGAQYPSSLE
jgi:hypothetical protein